MSEKVAVLADGLVLAMTAASLESAQHWVTRCEEMAVGMTPSELAQAKEIARSFVEESRPTEPEAPSLWFTAELGMLVKRDPAS